MSELAKIKITNLRKTKTGYEKYVLCGQLDPYRQLMRNKSAKAVAGPVGSNLIAQVKISNSGKKALRYRRISNLILFNDSILQENICIAFSEIYNTIVFYKHKNPRLIRHDGVIEKTVWHHSPNHILTVSLIPENIHLQHKRDLHIKGKRGGNAMYSV